MSFHVLPPLAGQSPNLDVRVGWDRPLGTFFATVTDERGGADIDIIALGEQLEEISDPAVVLRAVAPYAEIPAGLDATLIADMVTEGQRPRAEVAAIAAHFGISL
ncbi:hypothetical protein [Dactylosporangium sp. CA-139066]|uniref:hypothetical protein n=1 Tax=Dactylosporangium sp. CA-139066 TaxID=3239930 RepID=UPI003D8A4A05